MQHESEIGGFLTRRQKAGLSAVALIMSLLFGLQSYAILPYAVEGIRDRLTRLESDRRTDRDLIIKLDAQLIAAREEMIILRRQIENLYHELRRIQ